MSPDTQDLNGEVNVFANVAVLALKYHIEINE